MSPSHVVHRIVAGATKLLFSAGVYTCMKRRETEGIDMSARYDETAIAQEIVSVLPVEVARLCSDDRQSIRYAVRAEGLRLRSIVLSRASLRRLLGDENREVKIEYLRRELGQYANQRSEFRYPRPHPAAGLTRPVSLELPLASTL
jgi:hypothetical protein